MLPLAGGPYVYARRAYGDFGAFVVGWSDWLLRVSSMAYLAVALCEYSAALFPFSSGLTIPLAIVALILFTGLHYLGLRVGSRTQEVMSLFKVVVFLFIIVCAFLVRPERPVTQSAANPLSSHPLLLFAAIALALQNVIETYAGWNSPAYFAEESTQPSRNIPRSLFSGVLLVMGIYVLFNFAMVYALPFSKLAGSKLAAADVAQQMFGGRSTEIVTIIALVSVVGIFNASFLMTPRVLYALSRDGLFSSYGARVNAGGTPTGALLVTAAVAIVLTSIGSFEKLFAFSGFLAVAVDAATFAALFVLRKKEPDLSRPFRARGYPLLPAVVLAGAVVLLGAFVVSNTLNSVYALVAIGLSYPVYLFTKTRVTDAA
jgi:APA family basic amino acid/polyamine antiporter